MTTDNHGVIVEKDEDASLCDSCANADECRDDEMIVDACSGYWPREGDEQ